MFDVVLRPPYYRFIAPRYRQLDLDAPNHCDHALILVRGEMCEVQPNSSEMRDLKLQEELLVNYQTWLRTQVRESSNPAVAITPTARWIPILGALAVIIAAVRVLHHCGYKIGELFALL